MKRIAILLSAAFVTLSLVASFFRLRVLWGLGAWGAVAPLAGLVLAIILVPQMFVKSAPDPFRFLPRIPSRAGRLAAIAAASALVLWLLRSRSELWGERLSLSAALQTGEYRPFAPLGTFLQTATYRFMNAVFLSSADSILTFFSILAGTIYAVLAVRAAGLLFDGEENRGLERPAAAVLLTGGFAALFFGAGGTAQLAIVAALAFVTESIRLLRGKRSPALPAVLLALAVLFHVSAVMFVPPFVYLLAHGARAAGARKRTLAAGGLFVLCLAGGWIVPAVIAVKWWGAGEAGASMQFGFDGRTLLNALNALLVVGPASVAGAALLALGARKRERGEPDAAVRGELAFLAACGFSCLAGLVLGAPIVHGGLDWHALSVTGPALSIVALRALARNLAGTKLLERAIVALALAGAFHTIPLVLVDASPRWAERRLFGLALDPGRAETIVADFALEAGDLEKARASYLASIEKNPANVLAHSRLGRISMKQEEYPEAITRFLDAHELRPDDPHARFELAEALIANRWYPEAIAQLESLTVAYPESVAFWRRLGFARNNGNRYEPAVAAYERALALEPRNEENVRNLVSAMLNRGAELQEANRIDEARAMYERVIATYPDDWRAFNNLAVIDMRLNRLAEAREILEGAIARHPYESSLHFNMGIVLDKLGDYRRALHHMQLAADFDPVYSAAPPHIERLEKQLGIRHPAQPDSGAAPVE